MHQSSSVKLRSFFLLDVVYCPRRDCGTAVIRDKDSNAAMCSVCGFAFCVACRKTYHGADHCQGGKGPAAKAGKETEAGMLKLPTSQGTHRYFIIIKAFLLCSLGLFKSYYRNYLRLNTIYIYCMWRNLGLNFRFVCLRGDGGSVERLREWG